MEAAGLEDPQASPKGLRHSLGVTAASAGIPLNLVQKWLGTPSHHHGDLRRCRRR